MNFDTVWLLIHEEFVTENRCLFDLFFE